MTRRERRELRRNIADMRNRARGSAHWYVRQKALDALDRLETVELLDPRPRFWLRLRLRLAGVDAG